MRAKLSLASLVLVATVTAVPARAGSNYFFSTGNPDGKMATASRPGSTSQSEIETGDDFVLTADTSLTSASFTGLLPSNSLVTDISDVRVEIYRVFPKDSAPFDGKVPTRVNSPSDVEFADRSASAHSLSFTSALVNPSFTAANSVLSGIHASGGGDGAVTGQEVQINVNFSTPFTLPADHYFFVPQVELPSGDFYWLSAPRPIVPPGTSFPPGFTDLQSWIRNEDLAPDWLRVGTDMVGGNPAPTFNAAFSLAGTVPEPSSVILMGAGGLVLVGAARLRGRRAMPSGLRRHDRVHEDSVRSLVADPSIPTSNAQTCGETAC